MTRVIPMGSAERGNEIIRRIYVKSSTDRARSTGAYHAVRVGVARGSTSVDWLGKWSQAKHALTANTKFTLSGDADLNYLLSEGDEVVAEVTTTGEPASLDGMSVEVKGGRAGEVGDPNIDRNDGDYPSAASIASQLFTVSGQITDPETRDSVHALISALNESGITDWSHSVSLADAVSTADKATTYHDYDASTQAISSTSYVDGNVSIEVAVPSGKSVAVLVNAFCTIDANSGGANGYMAISDGTSEVVEAIKDSSGAGEFGSVGVSYAETITETTTYTMRLKYAAAAVDVQMQGISALAVVV